MDCKKNQIEYITLTNSKGAEVVLSNFGAGIVSVSVPDKDGNIENVVLTYANKEDFYCDGPYAGKIPGRFAGRITDGKFTLNGKEYSLSLTGPGFQLHGGPGEDSYANRVWNTEQNGNTVTYTLRSEDGDAGYPGAVDVEAKYTWGDDNTLTLELSATSDAPTIINLTNHVYFDLRGESKLGGEGIKGHLMQIDSSKYVELNDALMATGNLLPVVDTPMDFLSPKSIGQDLFVDYPALNRGKGIDTCWLLDNYDGELKRVAELYEPNSGRKMTLSTNQPAIQVYTGNWLSGCPASPTGYNYKDYDAVAMECQGYPDAPNHPNFLFKPLVPGEKYSNIIQWSFSAE